MEFIEEIIRRKGLGGARISGLLKYQLKYFFENRILGPDRILDEIAHLEDQINPSRTKPHKPLTGAVLSGCWHKHFTTAAFIPKNIANQFYDRKFRKIARKELSLLAQTAPSIEEVAGKIADLYVSQAYKMRASSKSLTGEWIIFKIHNGVNYYLTVATHDEGDDIVAKRINENCAAEYPELFSSPATA